MRQSYKMPTADLLQLGHGSLASWLVAALFVVHVSLHVLAAQTEPSAPAPAIGIPTSMDGVELPGTKLRAKPIQREKPIVLRVIRSARSASGFSYDLVYYGLEPGEFDLREYLEREDGTSADDLPPILVRIAGSLPPGQIEPHALQGVKSEGLIGYRLKLVAAGLAWLVGLWLIFMWGRRKRREAEQAAAPPKTLADRLRPVVKEAMAGTLTNERKAELERLLVAFWRKRLRLTDRKADEAIRILKDHPDAGPLLRQLEIWLHKPGDAAQIDLPGLLAPYKEIPADALESAA